MCNASFGYNSISVRSNSIKIARPPAKNRDWSENIQLSWHCPKKSARIYYLQCRKLERAQDKQKIKVGETDCWECPNLLKLRQAEKMYGDNLKGWQITLIQIGVALIMAALWILLVWVAVQHLKVTP